MKKITKYILIGLVGTLYACGGSSGSDSGMLIEGTLTEGGGTEHTSLNLRHSSGERIENVEICALGECSTTDSEGQWGFVASESFNGGDVEFTIKGHGIDTTTTLNIPQDASEVFLDFQHLEDGDVVAEHITVDGETTHHEGESHN